MEELLKEINNILKVKNQEIEFLKLRVSLLEKEKGLLEENLKKASEQ